MVMTTKSMLTAQRLADGRVVYLTADRGWTTRDADAWLAEASAIDEALPAAAAQTELVVEPYRIEVDVDEAGRPHHKTTRERIRAEGPSAVLRRFGYERSSEPARERAPELERGGE
jgi:hypothetical protein